MRQSHHSEGEFVMAVGGSGANLVVAQPPQQMVFQLFQEMFATDQAITEANHEIGYNKSNVLIDVSDLTMLSRRAVNACHFIAAQDPEKSDLFEVDLDYFKWLINFNKSQNHTHLKKSLREAQKAAAQVNIIDIDNPKKDRWISVQLLGTTAIANGRLAFRIPQELRNELANPESYTFISMRISNAFTTRYAFDIYEKLSRNRLKGGTDWMTLDFFKESLKISDVKTLSEFKNLRRYVLDPSIEQINELSDIRVSYETRSGGGTRKITHIRFRVEPNPEGKLNLRTDYRQQLTNDIYEVLTREFGLTEENLAEMMEQRESWDNKRILDAIELTRDRIKKKVGPRIKYPGLYLMNAIRKGLALSQAERDQDITPLSLEMKEKVDEKHQQESSNAAKEGLRLFMDAEQEAKDEIFASFVHSPVFKAMTKGIKSIDDALANERVKTSLGSFAFQRLR
jgi:plasmid replication initiation protein